MLACMLPTTQLPKYNNADLWCINYKAFMLGIEKPPLSSKTEADPAKLY